jgi:MSHA pilin protein MshA
MTIKCPTKQETGLKPKHQANHHSTGFTLIELVVVVSVIAILSALALPRYINLQTQARVAKAQAILGSVKSAAALGRAACMVDRAGLTSASTCTAAGGTVNMDGATIAMINQYPAGSVDGIVAAAQLNEVADQIQITSGAQPTDPLTIDIVGGTAPNCRITYFPAAAGPAFTPPGLVSTEC